MTDTPTPVSPHHAGRPDRSGRPDGVERPGRSTRLDRNTRRAALLDRLGRGLRDDRGSATAEYAVVILAAVAFAGVLVAVMRSGEVQSVLSELVRGALSL
jgi:Flp pilus assembly pilin Flp